ncbi:MULTISPECIES: YigZ family protein [Ferrimonas]|uniref:YigZ family protein n=1 Tax=Ferrimonas TaxID=44011 RepID=UPI00041ABDA4|nr:MULTISPECIES: YigZ family protein [Ferrimonas]USD37602.1 YigZ family protein [Ferrimonas sp. SCSIO 43195]
MSGSFLVPSGHYEVEEVVKRSRFITWVAPVTEGKQARALQQRARQLHPEASHHCLAFNAGPPGDTRDIGASDDGEPAGSAGRPMLNVVLGADVGQLAVVVIRYFGGTKLGVGGLVRAYSGGVKLALETLPTEPFVPLIEGAIQVSYADQPNLEHWLSQFDGKIVSQSFEQQVSYRLALPLEHKHNFTLQLAQSSQGRLQVEWD